LFRDVGNTYIFSEKELNLSQPHPKVDGSLQKSHTRPKLADGIDEGLELKVQVADAFVEYLEALYAFDIT
jgi:hypothetical protein